MVSYVTCPTCQHTLKIEEGQMGRRHTCPSCNSPFLAGASFGMGNAPGSASSPSPAPAGNLNKTMLGEIEPPIHYNCPRCKKPLEDPASERGTKKPCPHCGQRVQVPNTSAPPSPLNKTMLGSTEPEAPPARLVPEPAEREERCLECGRNMTGWDKAITCPDCGSAFCSSLCIREHRYHAHDRRPRRRPAPEPEPESDNAGAIVGIVLGSIFFLVIIIVVIVMASSRRW